MYVCVCVKRERERGEFGIFIKGVIFLEAPPLAT